MHASKARFVTACQQSLALGAVLAVLAPAAGVISLDVVTQPAEVQVRTPLRTVERPASDGLHREGGIPAGPRAEPSRAPRTHPAPRLPAGGAETYDLGG
jgi:hypothetical protein